MHDCRSKTSVGGGNGESVTESPFPFVIVSKGCIL